MTNPPRTSIDYYILPNKIMCSAIGMWPFDEEPSTWKIVFARFRLVLCVLGILAVLVPEIMFVVVNWGDLGILTRVGCVIMSVAQIFIKTIYLLARRESTYRLCKDLKSLWDSSNDPTERETYEMFAYWARIGSIIFYLSITSTGFMYMGSGVFNYIKAMEVYNNSGSIRQLPLESWYGIDVTESPAFEIAFISQLLGIAVVVSAICGIISTCGVIILHISGQFRLVSVWITGIGIEINREKVDYVGQRPLGLVASLTKCIRHHQRLIHLVDEVNDLLTPIVFLHLLTSSVEICLSGFALLNNPTSTDLIRLIAYIISRMMQSLLYCGSGEILIHESRRLSYSLYLNIPWYKLPPVYRRYLILMILKTQRYCSISTITFGALSTHTLTTIFNTAASYFTLLRRMQDKSLSEK